MGVAYPDVKPEDGWASASRLEMWMQKWFVEIMIL